MPKKSESDLFQQIYVANRIVEGLHTEVLNSCGNRPAANLTVRQIAVLQAIRTRPGISGAEMSVMIGIDPSTISHLVARLEEQGHVQKVQMPSRRGIALGLTTKGRKTLRAAGVGFQRVQRKLEAKPWYAGLVKGLTELEKLKTAA